VIIFFQHLLYRTRLFCIFSFLTALSFTAEAAVTLVVPTPNYTGNYTISWSGAGYYSYLRQYKSSGDITLVYGQQSGSYNVTNMPVGNYYYYVVSCPSPGSTSCTNSPQVLMEVKTAPVPTPPPGAGESYEYDALGRLSKVRLDGVVKTIYTYDNAGNRTTVTE
jgi:YD repeat-containing protein